MKCALGHCYVENRRKKLAFGFRSFFFRNDSGLLNFYLNIKHKLKGQVILQRILDQTKQSRAISEADGDWRQQIGTLWFKKTAIRNKLW